MTNYITQEGLKRLKRELEELKTVKRKETIQRLQKAQEMGDLTENAEYAEAKEYQGFVEGRILELERLVREAIVIDGLAKEKDKSLITLGSTIKIRCEGKEKEYTIVGSNEADPTQNKISNESPLGRAFLGKKAREKVLVSTPRGEVEYEVLEVK